MAVYDLQAGSDSTSIAKRSTAKGPNMEKIIYRYGNRLDLDQVIELYRASTLGERRLVDNRATMENMIEHANLVVTAWDGELLVGIARTLTDFSYVGYLAA